MPESRKDTPEQRWAKQRSAERRRCPKCDRKSAMSSYYDDELGERVSSCRWCGYTKGRTYDAIEASKEDDDD